MKRIFCVLLAVCAITALGFSQDFKFSGYMNYGLGVETTNRDIDEAGYIGARVRTAGVDSEQTGGRFRLNGSYSNEDKTAGADLRIQLQGVGPTVDPRATNPNRVASGDSSNNNSTYNLGLAYAYGWIKPVELLTVKAGIVDDSTFVTAGPILRDDAGGGAGSGLFVKLTPIDGLDVGVGAYPRSSDGSNNNNRIESVGGWGEWYRVKYTFGVGYTMPEMFKVTASFRSSNKAGISSREQARAIGEFRLLAVENLTAIIEVEMDNIYNEAKENDFFKDEGKINIFETFAYKMDDLSFGLNAAQYTSKDDKLEDISLRFNPWVSYAMSDGKIVPRLDGVFFLGGDRNSLPTVTSGGDFEKYDRRMDVAPTYNKNYYVVSVRPSVKINVDNRTSFEIGDAFYYRKVDDKKVSVKKDKFVDNVFYVDLVVRF